MQLRTEEKVPPRAVAQPLLGDMFEDERGMVFKRGRVLPDGRGVIFERRPSGDHREREAPGGGGAALGGDDDGLSLGRGRGIVHIRMGEVERQQEGTPYRGTPNLREESREEACHRLVVEPRRRHARDDPLGVGEGTCDAADGDGGRGAGRTLAY